MNQFSRQLSLGALLLLSVSVSLGATTTSSVTVSPASSVGSASVSSKMIMPYPSTTITYTYNRTGVKSAMSTKPSLLKITCDTQAILKKLGMSPSLKLFSLGVEQNGFDYTLDLRNCSLWGNKQNAVYSSKTLTEKEALAKANAFFAQSLVKKVSFAQYGAAIVLAKNTYGGGMRPLMKDAASVVSQQEDANDLSGITIDDQDTGEVQKEYTSFSILIPYLVNGKAMYQQYGSPAGISLEVTADGVTSVNAPLLLFKAGVRTSDKMSADDMVKYIDKGANMPYWGGQANLVLGAPQKSFVLFTIWKENKNEVYLSSALSLAPVNSEVRDNRIVVSDYKLGNANFDN